MAREILVTTGADGERTQFLLEVFPEGDHWTSTLARLGDSGEPEPTQVAPRFYGVDAVQARRRMIAVLENEYDDVRPIAEA